MNLTCLEAVTLHQKVDPTDVLVEGGGAPQRASPGCRLSLLPIQWEVTACYLWTEGLRPCACVREAHITGVQTFCSSAGTSVHP